MDSELFVFADEPENNALLPTEEWKILSVEDDPTFQATICHALKGYQYNGRPITILTASSAQEAVETLSTTDNIALILLDVVMEADDAGLRLVKSVRDVLGDNCMRIVLLTGEPGMAPQAEVMAQYDIDEYWSKSDISQEKLIGVVNSNLRTWNFMNELRRARTGLQLILDASRSLYSKHSLTEFSHGVLKSISDIIGLTRGGIVCGVLLPARTPIDAAVLASTGVYADKHIDHIRNSELVRFQKGIDTAIGDGAHYFGADFTVLFFATHEIDGSGYIVIVDSAIRLSEFHINLLKVFSENVRSGFANVALINRVSSLAYYDEKLGILNRNGLLRELGNMSRSERSNALLLLFSIDDFQTMMIAFGEQYCDNLLISLVEEMSERLPETLVLSTRAPGSFAVICDAHLKADLEQLISQRMIMIQLRGALHHLRLTYALTELKYLEEAGTQEVLYLAESVLSDALAKGAPFMQYQDNYRSLVTSSYLMLQDVQRAIVNDEFTIHLQPKVRLHDASVVGFEALVRWQQADGSYIPPDMFIPLAEASGLISELDRQVMLKTLDAINVLKASGYALPVAFNAAVADLESPDYVDNVFSAMSDRKVDAQLLDIEITESSAMRDYETHEASLRRLISKGVSVSIDDFGTGYSSLAHVARLAATTLKIDRSFVQGLETSDSDRHVVEMVARLGRSFGYSVVAEGVETDAQRRMLLDAGCHIGQGYFYARPMPLQIAIEWLKDQELAAK